MADVALRKAGILVQLRHDVVVRARRKLRALRERVEILVHREALDLRQQDGQVVGGPGEHVMVPRCRGFGRKVEREGPIAAADCGRRKIDVPVEREVEDRGEQHDAVDADAVVSAR